MRRPRHISILFLLGITLAATAATAMSAKREQSPCGKPPALVTKRSLPKEEEEQAKKIRAQGQVAVVISEEGEVVNAKVVRASSPQAIELLMDWAKGMTFQARPGCGPFRTVLNFTLAE